jgi:hypothetical protein
MKVKPLEFDQSGRAGVYSIRETFGQGPKALMLAYGSRIIGHYDDAVEANLAAQEHHETYIKSQIEEDDQTDTDRLAERVRRSIHQGD